MHIQALNGMDLVEFIKLLGRCFVMKASIQEGVIGAILKSEIKNQPIGCAQNWAIEMKWTPACEC